MLRWSANELSSRQQQIHFQILVILLNLLGKGSSIFTALQSATWIWQSSCTSWLQDGEVLGLPKKPAFEGVINAAIKYGAATKGDVPYVTPKRVREELLVATIQKLESELDSFNKYLRDFGATLAADAKDSVTKDHLMDYITVTPNGFKFEGTADVSGVSRTSEWVASDLVAQLGHLEEELRGKLDDAIETMATKEDTLQLCKLKSMWRRLTIWCPCWKLCP